MRAGDHRRRLRGGGAQRGSTGSGLFPSAMVRDSRLWAMYHVTIAEHEAAARLIPGSALDIDVP